MSYLDCMRCGCYHSQPERTCEDRNCVCHQGVPPQEILGVCNDPRCQCSSMSGGGPFAKEHEIAMKNEERIN
jgi:hypothetical protein